jgi:MFS family permease
MDDITEPEEQSCRGAPCAPCEIAPTDPVAVGPAGKTDDGDGKPHSTKNYILSIINGTLFRAYAPFVDEHTIIPLLVRTLTNNSIFVGLAVGIRHAGWFIPQLFIANIVAGKKKKNPTYIFWGFVRVVALLAIVLSVLLSGAENKALMLVLFLSFWAMLQLSAGMAGVSFMDVVGKTIHPTKLGSMWGFRFFFGGLSALGFGFLVRHVIVAYAFPYNYVFLFSSALIIMTIAIASWCFADEEPDRHIRPKKNMSGLLKEGVEILKSNPVFRSYYFACIIHAFYNATSAFFIVYALANEIIGGVLAAWLVVAKMTGLVLPNFIWARMLRAGDARSAARVMTVVCLIGAALPFAVMFAATTAVGALSGYLFLFFYFLVGSMDGAWFMATKCGIIFITPEKNRPIYLGLMSTMLGPVILALALTTGIIAQTVSFEAIFVLAAVAMIAALFFVRRIAKAA